MGFSRFVEIGRVVLINYGDLAGKLCTVIDVVDQNKALVEGIPGDDATDVRRQMIPFKRLSLTDIVVKIPRNARQKTMKAAWAEADVTGKWAASGWGKKLASKAKRAANNDFDRFKLMVARKQRAKAVKAAM